MQATPNGDVFSSVALNLDNIRRIAVLRALKLGDMLCLIPALRHLRETLPDAEIDLIGLPCMGGLCEKLKEYVTNFVPFPGFPTFPEQDFDPYDFSSFLHFMQSREYDLFLNFHGCGIGSHLIGQLSGANLVAGFTDGSWDANFPNLLTFSEPDGMHERDRYLFLLSWLGFPQADNTMTFPLKEEDHALLRERIGKTLEGQAYVCLHPGASDPQRRWSTRNFQLLAERIAQAGYKIVLTGRPDEAELTASIKVTSGKVFDVSRLDLDVGPLAALLAHAALVVSNDTGIAHLSVACNAPTVTVFCRPELMGRWAQHDSKRFVSVDGTSPGSLAEVEWAAFQLLAPARTLQEAS